MAALRVFTAVELPSSVTKKMDSAIRRLLSGPAFRPVALNALHITLNFVGDVEDKETPELCRAFSAAVDGLQSFHISLSGLGAFPNFERPRVLWVGVDEGESELKLINEKLRDVIEEFGFVQEKRYKAHVTVARIQNRHVERNELQRIRNEFERIQWMDFQATEVIVFNSVLQKDGPIYIPLATLQLKS